MSTLQAKPDFVKRNPQTEAVRVSKDDGRDGPVNLVRVRAKDVHQTSDNEWVLEIPAVRMTNGQEEMLHEMFPDCGRDIERMCGKQALISALIIR